MEALEIDTLPSLGYANPYGPEFKPSQLSGTEC
jgi:hypothetical protein